MEKRSIAVFLDSATTEAEQLMASLDAIRMEIHYLGSDFDNVQSDLIKRAAQLVAMAWGLPRDTPEKMPERFPEVDKLSVLLGLVETAVQLERMEDRTEIEDAIRYLSVFWCLDERLA